MLSVTAIRIMQQHFGQLDIGQLHFVLPKCGQLHFGLPNFGQLAGLNCDYAVSKVVLILPVYHESVVIKTGNGIPGISAGPELL